MQRPNPTCQQKSTQALCCKTRINRKTSSPIPTNPALMRPISGSLPPAPTRSSEKRPSPAGNNFGLLVKSKTLVLVLSRQHSVIDQSVG